MLSTIQGGSEASGPFTAAYLLGGVVAIVGVVGAAFVRSSRPRRGAARRRRRLTDFGRADRVEVAVPGEEHRGHGAGEHDRGDARELDHEAADEHAERHHAAERHDPQRHDPAADGVVQVLLEDGRSDVITRK